MREARVLVGLDLSEMDSMLIRFLRLAGQMLEVSTVTFLHNIRLADLPESLPDAEKLREISSKIKADLTALIKTEASFLRNFEVEVSFENYGELAFLQVSKRMQANLSILGHKVSLTGRGELPAKLVRMFPHSTLLVPEGFNGPVRRIVQAIDFSKYSPFIQEVGKQIVNRLPAGALEVLPVFVIPAPVSFLPGATRMEMDKELQQESLSKQKRWSRWFPDSAPLTVIQPGESSIAVRLSEFMQQVDADMVILGVTGSASSAGLSIGRVTSELIRQKGNWLVWVAKMQTL